MQPVSPATLIFLLLCGHALADFSLQTEWIATNKNRHVRLQFPAEQRAKMQVIWPYLMTAHALMHGLMVYLITERLSVSLAETAVHWITDYGKCERWYGFHADQLIHIGSKILWAGLIVYGVV